MTDARPVTRSYLPGEWYAVLGPDLVVALPPDRRDLAASVWSALDAGAGPDEVLDLVLAAGLSGLAGLALVSSDGTRTRALARGAVACRLANGTAEVVANGRTATTWQEVVLDDVTALSVELGRTAGPEAERLLVADGLVRAAHLLWTADGVLATSASVGAEAAGSSPEPPEQPEEPVRAGEPVTADGPADPPETAPAVIAPAPGSVPGPAPLAAPVPQDPPTPAQAPDDVPAEPSWLPEPADHDGHTHDGHTQDGSWSAEEFLRHQHAIPGQHPAPPVTSRPVAVLQLSTGESVDVDRVVVLGRAPEARRFTATEQPRLVTVPSPQQEISSTHLEVRPGSGADHGSAVVTDLGSTNGTVLVQPGLPAEPLRPGIPVQLLPGAVIDLGDGLTITVGRP